MRTLFFVMIMAITAGLISCCKTDSDNNRTLPNMDTLAVINQYYKDHPNNFSFAKTDVKADSVAGGAAYDPLTYSDANIMIGYYKANPLPGKNPPSSFLFGLDEMKDFANYADANGGSKMQFILARKDSANGPLTLVITAINTRGKHVYTDILSPGTKNCVYEHCDPCPKCLNIDDYGILETPQ